MTSRSAVTWSRAWRSASRQFWGAHDPAHHFTTSAGVLLAERLCEVVRTTDEHLGSPSHFTVVDLGAGDGGLLAVGRRNVVAYDQAEGDRQANNYVLRTYDEFSGAASGPLVSGYE